MEVVFGAAQRKQMELWELQSAARGSGFTAGTPLVHKLLETMKTITRLL